jgi:hypothetical protein
MTPTLIERLDRYVGDRFKDRSEAVRCLLGNALDVLEERARSRP